MFDNLYRVCSVLLLAIVLTVTMKDSDAHVCGPIDDNTTWAEVLICLNTGNPTPPKPEPIPEPGLPPIVGGCAASSLGQLRNCIKDNTVISMTNDISVSGCPTQLPFNGVKDVTLNGNGYKILRTSGQRSCPVVTVYNSAGITFENISFDDDPNTAPCAVSDKCARMIDIKDASDIEFTRTTIQHAKSYTLYTNRVNGFKFTESELSDAGILGLYIGHGDTPSTNVVISDNVFARNSTNAVAILGGRNVTIQNNVFDNNHREGRWAVAPKYGEGFTGGGQLYLARGTDVRVLDNELKNGRCDNCRGGVHAIELSEPNKSNALSNVVIEGNTIGTHTGSDIYTNSGATVVNLKVGDTVTTPVTPPPAGMTSCRVQAATLGAAIEAYGNQCTLPRKDCDPIDGVWVCSSETMGAVATPIAPTPTTPTGRLLVQAESVPLTSGWKDLGDGSITWLNNEVAERYSAHQRNADAHMIYSFDVPTAGVYRFNMRAKAGQIFNAAEPPNDFWLRVGNNDWLKVFYTRDGAWHEGNNIRGEVAGKHSQALLDFNLPAGPTAVIISGRSRGAVIDWLELVPRGFSINVPATGAYGLYQQGDFISINHDSYPDQDDAMAIVANREILDEYNVDYQVVKGTMGHAYNGDLPGQVAHFESLFPNFLNVKEGITTANQFAHVNSVANKWTSILNSGKQVHVAEGGTSDFTVQVLKRMEANGVSNLKNVRIYQHSAGSTAFNELKAAPGVVSYAKRVATYIPIGNGNAANNNTADLNENNTGLENAYKSSQYGKQWAYGLSVITAGRTLDFSDSVELLYILGVGKERVSDVRSFYNAFVK